MRDLLRAILERLLATSPNEVSLDDVGEAIGAEWVSQAEIEELFDALERAGRRIGGATPDLREHLRLVVGAARALGKVAGREPSIVAIAERSGLTVSQVRAALLYASVLSR